MTDTALPSASPLPPPGPPAVLPAAGLLRVLGTAFGVAIAVGATIGGGILRTPGEVAAALPHPGWYLAAWAVGGIVILLGTNVYSELGAALPHAGGPYVYARRAFGDGLAFFVGYADWLNWALGPVLLSLIVGEYIGGLIPPLGGHPLAVAFAVVGGLAALQWIGVRSGGRTQEITTLLKGLALLGLVVAAFALPHADAPVPIGAPAPPVLPHGLALLVAFGVAMQGVIFTYDSYYAVVYCGEEIRDPGRDIPRTMFRGVWLIIGIYLLVNLAYLSVVPVGRMAGDPFVGATMATALFGPRGDTIIRLVMVVSILGTINAELMAVPRILLAMSRDGLFPRAAARVNAGGTPTVALGLSLLVIAGFLLTGSFGAVLPIAAILGVVMYVCAFAAFFVLRRREPGLARPYRARGYPWLPALALLSTLALAAALAVGDPRSALLLLAVLVASWPASRVVRRLMRRGRPDLLPPDSDRGT
ncbi:MAG TPA: APC family permease [Gemmatimonadales bacterium]|nr:APC family permease [Gemmatimonadales bacterium]